MLGVICHGEDDGEETAALGAAVSQTLSTASRWSLSVGYRWQDSYRHFVGDVEQPQRLLQQTQQENRIHLFDVGIGYVLTPRWSLSISAPIMKADRINHRTGGVTSSVGIGDMSIGASTWIFRPPSENHMNIQVGMGLKMPTGRPDVTDHVTTNGVTTTTTVDQSIQLGDSGWGFSLNYMAYKAIRRFTLYSTGTYLFNPKNTYTAKTPGARQLSVPDQYLWRTGLGYAVPKLRGFAFTFAGRMEGVPARDLIGREDGFRRPGYYLTIEPGINHTAGHATLFLGAPVRIHQNVKDSLGFRRDSTFASHMLLMSVSYRFGGRRDVEPPPGQP